VPESITISRITSRWLPEQVAAIAQQQVPAIPVIGAADVHDALPGFQLWDCWTFETPQGATVVLDGWTPWVVMCAPRDVQPDLRHDIARLRLMLERDCIWRDCGFLLPEDHNPGPREWAGSTVYDAASGRVTLFYTATGRRGDTGRSFEQRLFQTSGKLELAGDMVRVTDWSEPVESVARRWANRGLSKAFAIHSISAIRPMGRTTSCSPPLIRLRAPASMAWSVWRVPAVPASPAGPCSRRWSARPA